MTNKIKFKLKITGFELEMEGTKEGTAAVTNQFTEAMRGLITPPSIDGEPNGKSSTTEDAESMVISSSTNGSSKKRPPRKSSKPNNQNGESQNMAIDFKHDPEKFGNPLQDWNTATKSLWLLYVIKSVANKNGLTTLQITDTFNKHFKQSKMVIKNNVSRDLGKLKAKANSLVAEETTKKPTEWYLTDNGQKEVQRLIAEQKSKNNGVS